MAMSIQDRLNLIKQGLLTEAMQDDDVSNDYNLGPDDPEKIQDDSASSDEKPPEDKPVTDEKDEKPDNDYSMTDDTAEDDSKDPDDTAEEDPAEPATTDDIPQDDSPSQEPTSKPGEFLPLDEGSRKILAYRNFQRYRELGEDIKGLLVNMTETPTFTSLNNGVLKVAIDKCSSLLTKIDDYILYKYRNTSYEVNYKNFAEFIIEKNLIDDLYKTILLVK